MHSAESALLAGDLGQLGVMVSLDVLQPYSGMDGDHMLRILAPDMDKKVRNQEEGP